MALYEAGIPIIGQHVGVAVYEREGDQAFFLETKWTGRLIAEIGDDDY